MSDITITINSDMTAVEIAEAIQAQMPVKKKFPRWEELGEINGWFSNIGSTIHGVSEIETIPNNKNIWPTKELAEASLALSQLAQLRDYVNGDWKPDWTALSKKDCITIINNGIAKDYFHSTQQFLTFKDAETRDGFLEAYRDLIEVAKPLL